MASLPFDVLERIALQLAGNDKVNLALCCKAMLPVLYKGFVSVGLDKPKRERPLLQLSRCLSQQPDGVSHLKLFSSTGFRRDTRQLIELSLLSNLRKLSLDDVELSLPALQPVATRLQGLCILRSSLTDSADGFLSASWSALETLSIKDCWATDVLTMLKLPALESLNIGEFGFGHAATRGFLQPDQLCCPQLSSLVFSFDTCPETLASKGSRQCYSLLNLPRLATLSLKCYYVQATWMDLGLPASLTHLTVQQTVGHERVDLKWVLLQAGTGISSGAQLQSLTCADTMPSSHPEGMPWGASSNAHYRGLGERLSGLKDLSIYGRATTLLSAASAVACSAPDLTRLEFRVEEELEDFELPPICSASLKTISGRFKLMCYDKVAPPPPVILTILPGCTQLRDVHVQFYHNYSNMPKEFQRNLLEGASVKIRCHCTSRDASCSWMRALALKRWTSGSCRCQPPHRVWCRLTQSSIHATLSDPSRPSSGVMLSCPVSCEACGATQTLLDPKGTCRPEGWGNTNRLYKYIAT